MARKSILGSIAENHADSQEKKSWSRRNRRKPFPQVRIEIGNFDVKEYLTMVWRSYYLKRVLTPEVMEKALEIQSYVVGISILESLVRAYEEVHSYWREWDGDSPTATQTHIFASVEKYQRAENEFDKSGRWECGNALGAHLEGLHGSRFHRGSKIVDLLYVWDLQVYKLELRRRMEATTPASGKLP